MTAITGSSQPNNPAFKYQEEINALQDCAPHEWSQSSGVAYRWVKNPISDKCFLPFTKQRKRNAECCTDVGLSMYRSEDQAKAAYVKTCIQFPNFLKKALHAAVGTLDPTCGMTTVPDAEGHFDLHEFEAADLAPAFTITCPL